jgi:hypothetical protein
MFQKNKRIFPSLLHPGNSEGKKTVYDLEIPFKAKLCGWLSKK